MTLEAYTYTEDRQTVQKTISNGVTIGPVEMYIDNLVHIINTPEKDYTLYFRDVKKILNGKLYLLQRAEIRQK